MIRAVQVARMDQLPQFRQERRRVRTGTKHTAPPDGTSNEAKRETRGSKAAGEPASPLVALVRLLARQAAHDCRNADRLEQQKPASPANADRNDCKDSQLEPT
jgi:hypothetical protein